MPPINQQKKRNVQIIIYTDVLDQIFFGDTGAVSIVTRQAADAVLQAAQANIGTYYSGDHPGPKLKDSGKVLRSPTGPPEWMVQFRHRAAEVHHEGARAHNFTVGKVHYRASGADGPFGPIRAPFHKDGRRIDHPGHRANRYLVKAARDVGLRVTQSPGGPLGRRGGARVPRGFV